LRGKQPLLPRQHQDAAQGHRDALQTDQHDENQDEALQHEQPLHAARILGCFEKQPRALDVFETPEPDHRAEGNQEQQHADQVENGLAPQAGRTIEDIDAHMAVDQQRIAGHRHEHRTVQPDVEVLHPQVRRRQQVTLHDDDEAQ